MTNHLGSTKIINSLLHPRFSSWRTFSSLSQVNIFLFRHSTLIFIHTELNLQQLLGNFTNDFYMEKIITDIVLLIPLLILGEKEKYWENVGLLERWNRTVDHWWTLVQVVWRNWKGKAGGRRKPGGWMSKRIPIRRGNWWWSQPTFGCLAAGSASSSIW